MFPSAIYVLNEKLRYPCVNEIQTTAEILRSLCDKDPWWWLSYLIGHSSEFVYKK